MEKLTLAGIVAILTLIVGIAVKVIGLPDQIRKNYSKKSTEGLSVAFMALTFIAYFLWTLHGILQNDLVLVLGQGLGILASGIILIQIIIYRRNK